MKESEREEDVNLKGIFVVGVMLVTHKMKQRGYTLRGMQI